MGRDLTSIVDDVIDLPTLPQVVTTLIEIIDRPQSTARDVQIVMERDPALAARILKLVNSAFYALPNRISSIGQAVVILGYNTVKSLAISASVVDLFGEGGKDFNYEDFWAHSVGSAAVSYALAKRTRQVDPDTAFVTGLMHDMGKIVLDQYAPDEFHRILTIARDKEIPFEQAEGEVLDTSADEVGYWLAQKWALADDLGEAIRFQHRVDEAPSDEVRDLAAICAFAVYVCQVKEFGRCGSFGRPEFPRQAWERVGLHREELPRFIKTVNEELHHADEFLKILRS